MPQGRYFSKNGRLTPVDQATVSLDDINYAYGFGVYETLKVRAGQLYFADLHVDRLLHSAQIIDLDHPWTGATIEAWLADLVQENAISDANLKMLLVGGASAAEANLFIVQLNPLFPQRQFYRDGVKVILSDGERQFPQAKSLNMLLSAMAYRQAQRAGAYDALFVNRDSLVTEGTRTNLFWTDGRVVYTPPAAVVLAGVTKETLGRCLAEEAIELIEADLPKAALGDSSRIRSVFLTSTSSKVMPVSLIEDQILPIDPLVRRIMKVYDAWLERWAADHQR